MYCRKCGQQITDDSLFCNYCGQSVNARAVPVASENMLAEKKCRLCGNTFYGKGSTCGVCDKRLEYSTTDINGFSTLSNSSSKANELPRNNSGGCAVAVVVGSVILLIFLGIVLVSGTLYKEIKESEVNSQYTDYNDNKITLAEFNQIETGMSYEETCDIIGGSGTVVSETNISGYHTVMISWYGKGSSVANANVTIMNDAVIGKSQLGLS